MQFKKLNNELIPGKLYKVIKGIAPFGCGFCDENNIFPFDFDKIPIAFGDILLFNGVVEEKVSAFSYHNHTEQRCHFLNKTSFVYIKNGWINTDYLELIHDTTKF